MWSCVISNNFTLLFVARIDQAHIVLCSYLGISHHQADACHLASVYLGFRSIWNTHFCLRLQPHLYPSLVATRLGRDVRPNSDISQRMSSPTPPSKIRNYCWIKVGDSQRWTHIENPTRLNVIDPDWDYMMVHFSKLMVRSQSGLLCTDDDILIEFIFCIFSLKNLGFWGRQVHWKPLSTRGTLYP